MHTVFTKYTMNLVRYLKPNIDVLKIKKRIMELLYADLKQIEMQQIMQHR